MSPAPTRRPSRRQAGHDSDTFDYHGAFRESLLQILRGETIMTDAQARRIADACILERQARAALAESERLGQRDQSRADRAALANAEHALAALIREAGA